MKHCTLCGFPLKHISTNRFYCTPCKQSDRAACESEDKYHRWYHNDQNKLERRYANYQKGAQQRGLTFALTLLDFRDLWGKPCYYCGEEIQTIGIDRYLNSCGYTLDNVVPCCKFCNFAKRDMDGDDFIALCTKVASNN